MPAAPDPFPRDAFAALLGRLPRYARLALRLARDPRVPRSRRATLLAAGAYLASPIDLVPGIIPVAGQLDDAAAVLLALRAALNGLPADDRAVAFAEAGLEADAIDIDLRTIGSTYAWLGRRAARLAWRGTKALARAGRWLGANLAGRVRGG